MLQIGYEPERDRLTWDGWDIHCGQGLEVLLPDRLGGGTWRPVSFEYNAGGWYMPGQPGLSPVGLWARESDGGMWTQRNRFIDSLGFITERTEKGRGICLDLFPFFP